MRILKRMWTFLVTLLSLIHVSQAGEFTLVGWQQSVDEDGTLTVLDAIADQHVAISGDKVYVPSLNKLIAEYAAQANTVTHVQLQSPSLRRVALLDIAMCQGGIRPSGGESFIPHFNCPIELEVGEGLEAYINKPADSAIVATILAWLADGALTPVTGEIFTVRFTATITSILTQWVNGAITLGQTLPVGRYAIVGADVMEAGGDLIGFRFVVPGYEWRPGSLTCGDLGAKPNVAQRYGGMGIWAEFESLTPPTLDIIAAAAAAQTVVGHIDLMKIG